MSSEKLIHKHFGKVHGARKTPWMGVVVTFGLVLLLVFTGNLKVLAQTTSLLILVVFLMVHASLLKVKWRKDPHHGVSFHFLFPALGAISCIVLLTFFSKEVYLRSTLWLGLGLAIWMFNRISNRKKKKR